MTEYIEIRGARENNLKDITLRIPKRQITIFTGVSGSGKSSIVFDTIATEAQRQLYENMDVVRRADWVVDLGPEGGSKGWRVVFAGTPAALAGARQSLTSRYLAPDVVAASP
jgi:excinuclease UvrABC ATPase subunit